MQLNVKKINKHNVSLHMRISAAALLEFVSYSIFCHNMYSQYVCVCVRGFSDITQYVVAILESFSS